MAERRPRQRTTSARDAAVAFPFHSPHDYRLLVQRWRAVARLAGLKLQSFASAGTLEILHLKTPALQQTGGIYLSAGIHGDEPGAPEALITWAERLGARLAELPLFIFPCLNPWGLLNNIRLDASGTDLNRVFHLDAYPVVNAIKERMVPYQFDLAVLLHEDYDGQGLYMYEIKRESPFWGEELLDCARPIIAIDSRRRIDRRQAANGLIRRRFDAQRFARFGYPEAIWLHEHHARRALTVETPSEFALEQRVAAHLAVLDECVRRVLVKPSP